jgi:hypothetical protein
MTRTARCVLALAAALGLHFAAAGAPLAADDDLLEACKEFSTNQKICDCIEEKVTDDDERQEMIGCYRAAAAAKKGRASPDGPVQQGIRSRYEIFRDLPRTEVEVAGFGRHSFLRSPNGK